MPGGTQASEGPRRPGPQVGGDESRGDTVRVRALATVTFLAQKRPKVSWEGTGVYWEMLGGLWAILGRHWDTLGGHLGVLKRVLEHIRGVLRRYWVILGGTGIYWGESE